VRFLFEFPLVADGPVNAYGAETGFWPNPLGIALVAGDPISGNSTAFAFRRRRRQQPVFEGQLVNNSLDIDLAYTY
jgi:hypothetical protein